MTAAATVASQLGARRVGKNSYVGACPECEYPKAFSIRQGHSQVLYTCHAGCDRDVVMAALRGLPGRQPSVTPRQPSPRGSWLTRTARENDQTATARAFLARSLPGSGTQVEAYLESRGLRHHAALRLLPAHHHVESERRFPVMIAAVVHPRAAGVVGVHRTFLAEDGSGKANVEPAKKTLGHIQGGAVQLDPPKEDILVAEGIETALTVRQELGIPTWAALSAGGLQRLELPELPLATSVLIAADHDTPGLDAAHKAAERWTAEGRRVRIAQPPKAGTDFNDLIAPL